MSTINSKNVQVGTSGVATDNFTLYQPATPDGTVRLGVGNSGATTGDVVTVNSAGVTVTGTLTATTLSGSLGAATATSLTVAGNNISAVNSLGFRNRILNGDCRIDQRNAGASVTPTNEQYTLDRWQAWRSQASKYSVQQNAGSVTPPAGFSNYLGVTSLSAYSIAVSDYFMVSQKVEGLNVSDFAWGTASAQAVTLSFWVRSSLTGTFGGSVQNSAQNRSYPFTYTVSAANTWEQKTISIAGDTSGTWLSTNGVGLYLWFGLGVGSNFSGTAGAWNANNNFSATGATSVVGTNGATFYITGVQLEAGTVASPFERRDYGRELIMCQRYAFELNNTNVSNRFGFGMSNSAFQCQIQIKHPVTMRTTPSLLVVNLASTQLSDTTAGFAATAIAAQSNVSGVDASCVSVSSSGLTVYRSYFLEGTAATNAKLIFSAEL